MHHPGNEAGGRQPVAACLDPPYPETVALVDFNSPPFAATCALPNPEIRTLRFNIISSFALNVVALEVDETFADLFTP